MAAIRPETEIDRTQAALAQRGLELPLARGVVEVRVDSTVASTVGAQRLVTLLVNELLRMKGLISTVHICLDDDVAVLRGTPLRHGCFLDGVATLADTLNTEDSPYKARLHVGPAPSPDVSVRVGQPSLQSHITVASDGWRALFGDYSRQANWEAPCPVGCALAAALTTGEVFKRLLIANGATQAGELLPDTFAMSAWNYALNENAAQGPVVGEVRLNDPVIVGCGAGGSGVAYVLAMHPGLVGSMSLVEPGVHKLSNLNRYLASSATDVHHARHKLATLAHHLATYAPQLELRLNPQPWEQLSAHPWSTIVSAVDTVEARWAIQKRSAADARIIDIAVLDLLYAVLRVEPNGRCLFCKHPYDPELAMKQRAARWGVRLATVRSWTETDRTVDTAMVEQLARTQGRTATEFSELLSHPFSDTPRLLECGATSLSADVPSQAPILPIATTAAAAVAAAELIKNAATADSRLDNSLAHDLRRNPSRVRRTHRRPLRDCPEHSP